MFVTWYIEDYSEENELVVGEGYIKWVGHRYREQVGSMDHRKGREGQHELTLESAAIVIQSVLIGEQMTPYQYSCGIEKVEQSIPIMER